MVAARSGALPEIVRDEQDGALFTPGDTRDAAHAIMQLFDPAYRPSAVDLQARATQYSPQKHATALLAVYAVAGAEARILTKTP